MSDPRSRDETARDVDLAPEVGAATDVARLGSRGPTPPHEQTADLDADVADWERIAALPEFRRLLRDKAAFVVPATTFFVVYYFALPVLVGWFPELMRRRIGPVNLAYAFALSQFFMAWLVAWAYLRRASVFDAQAEAILEQAAQFEPPPETASRR
jgi:uncharacterized membrane protein (DUF485 family)